MGYRRVLPIKRNTGTSPACSLTNCADLDLLSYLSGDICKMARSMYNCKSSMGVNVPNDAALGWSTTLEIISRDQAKFYVPQFGLTRGSLSLGLFDLRCYHLHCPCLRSAGQRPCP